MKPLFEIEDNHIFYRGARFRLYNINGEEKDYYEYMLANIPGETEHMLLTCVEGYKSGNALALVKTSIDNNNTVNGEAMKYSMGLDNTFLISE